MIIIEKFLIGVGCVLILSVLSVIAWTAFNIAKDAPKSAVLTVAIVIACYFIGDAVLLLKH